ncbi:pyridoxal phosphate-dependent decarboxylase family protein [Edaphobacter modestus]|uniref:Glutamate/tyrosine decarboxylase-like PLP-dependent enzyme n=1 Tax=Edaphobacter modestus TaxID=388466 RepID=A0A4V2G509_9BACT|nr:aminotransferase class I/II-fold pyridoxal phosphate-dependent enzyme [Edaphobacter modestus]RZU42276.1 glutamate/tyrosine decarboxylase-like PLP-dependent enzyme [Edaphobacter modestus]
MSSVTHPTDELFALLSEAQHQLDAGFSDLPPAPSPALGKEAAAILKEAATRLHDNYPYAHPLYAGQMLKPPHPIARAAYALTMSVNPNNHALDGGRASSAMELETVAELAKMFGFPQHLGHLSSSGTFANLEALWVSGQTLPGRGIAASDQAHYTHTRISGVLGLPFVEIPSDRTGRMDMAALEQALRSSDIGTVVATLGTTAVGAVDPLPQILELQKKYNFRIHIDSAYGGYFTLAGNLGPEARAAFDLIPQADSIVVDPHKHGLQPYGCGAVLFRDPTVGRFYKHDSPFTYFSSKELHLGEISLECSRAGASAVALWATQRLLPYTRDGEFARNISTGREAALEFNRRIAAEPRFLAPNVLPQLDIVFYAVRSPEQTPEASSALAKRVFDEAARLNLHLALASLPLRFFPSEAFPGHTEGHVTCLRSVMMKPEHLAWLDEIWQRLDQASSPVASSF